MPKHESSDDDSQETPENSSDSEEELQDQTPNNGVSEYEKQRLSRIADNKARIEALGLPKIASSLMGSSPKVRNTKKKEKVDDEDYRPVEGEERLSSSSDEEEANEDDEDYLAETSSGSRRKKVKSQGSKPKKKVPVHKHLSDLDYIDNDDALRQAIALSLQDSAEVSGVAHSGPSQCSDAHVVNTTPNERKGNARNQEDIGRRKRKKSFTSRLQMTEDELVVNFFQIGDEWNGCITLRDLQKVAIAHDFTWTDEELADMIYCFDSDKDGKLSLDDFRKIVGRCNMIKGSESC